MSLAPGDKLGPYEILAAIGKGGMGEVYKAHDPRLNRDVAIKVSAERFSERFGREARVIASLNHPNICTLFDIGPNYLVMEYIEGDSPKGPLPLATVLDFARQMADALDAAHEKGITHRDLKPANLKVTPDGRLKVLDFGLAQIAPIARADSSADNSPTLTIGMTEVGMILGTAAYMAPEQAKGKSVDKRADIWAFGVVLHELTTGRRLFQGSDVTDVLASVLKDQPLFDQLPSQLVPLLKCCLQKDPKQRLRDIADAAVLLDTPPPADVRVESRRGSWIPSAVAAVSTVALIALAALWLRPGPLPEVTRFQIYAPPGSSLPVGTPAPSPDGRLIAYTVADAAGVGRIHLRRMDRTGTTVLPGTEGAFHPFWSPDGRSIAFVADNAMKRVDIDGGFPRVLLEGVTGPWHGDWNQQGEILAALGGISRLSARSNGGATTIITSPAGHPAFLPDGKRILFRSESDKGYVIHLSALDAKNADPTTAPIVLESDSAPLLASIPNGKVYLLYIRGPDLFAVEFDPAVGKVIGDPVVIVPNIGRVASPPVKPAVGVSRSGVLAFQSGGEQAGGELTWWDRAGKPQGKIPLQSAAQWVSFSPDGLSLATRQTNDFWVTDLARGTSTRITTGSRSFAGAWSPDGKRIAFSRSNKMMAVNVDGSGEETLVEQTGTVHAWFAGGLLAYDGTQLSLFSLPPKGPPTPLAQNIVASTVSPDGKFFAYASRPSARLEVFVQAMPPATGRTQVSVNGGNQPHWRRDGKELYFASPDGAIMAVDITLAEKPTIGIPHELFRVPGLITGWDVFPDGKRFLFWTPSGGNGDSPITVVLNWWAELGK
ncbi:MAG: protein kinase [Acidobacteriota bacterium]